MKALSIPMICNRIAVQAPYFAFTALEGEGRTIRGEFIPEQDIGYEAGPIATAELGRHLAILGSCAAVILGTDEKTYYLASKGRLSLFGKPRYKQEGKYHATAQVIAQDKRTLKVHAVASDGEPFAHLDCEYTILSDALFTKTFRNYRATPAPVPAVSPYTRPIALEYDPPQALTLTARSKPLLSGCFSGHFVEYPAWPVAIIADTVSQVISRLLHGILEEPVRYRVAHVDIKALRLISASESLFFRVECAAAFRLLSRYIFSAQVSRGDIVAATMEVEVYV